MLSARAGQTPLRTASISLHNSPQVAAARQTLINEDLLIGGLCRADGASNLLGKSSLTFLHLTQAACCPVDTSRLPGGSNLTTVTMALKHCLHCRACRSKKTIGFIVTPGSSPTWP